MNEIWFEYKFKLSHLLLLTTHRHVKNSLPKPRFSIQHVSHTVEIDLTQDSETLFSKLGRTVRSEIRGMEKQPVKCYFHNDIDSFINFYNDFANAKNIYPTNKARMAEVADYLEMSYAELDGEILAAHSYLVDKEVGIVRLLHSASKRFDDTIDKTLIGKAGKLLTYKDMLYYKEKGFKIMDMGGYAEGTTDKSLQGINNFKMSFGGEKVVCNDYYSPTLYILQKMAEKLDRRY